MKTYKQQWIHELTRHIQELDIVIEHWRNEMYRKLNEQNAGIGKTSLIAESLKLKAKRDYLNESRQAIKFLDALYFIPKRFPSDVYLAYKIKHPEIANKIENDGKLRKLKLIK